jgi:hypothetical protein
MTPPDRGLLAVRRGLGVHDDPVIVVTMELEPALASAQPSAADGFRRSVSDGSSPKQAL